MVCDQGSSQPLTFGLQSIICVAVATGLHLKDDLGAAIHFNMQLEFTPFLTKMSVNGHLQMNCGVDTVEGTAFLHKGNEYQLSAQVG